MKKSHLALVISAVVFITAIIWLLSIKKPISVSEISQFGVIAVLIGFGIYFGLKRLKSEKRGEPAEDELSKRVLQKASSASFFISIYLWLAVMYVSDKTTMETHTLIGTGILGMAILFFICWIFYKVRGLKDA
jgi:ABC-type transport system involved in multi-copper enzyme maturation permease subunit